MLRVNVGLSRKMTKDYNSTGYSINVDGEVTAPVTDSEEVIEQVKELFDLAEEALNQEIERVEGESAIAGRDARSEAAPTKSTGRNGNSNDRDANTAGDRNDQRNGNRDETPATNKQINFLLSIGKRLGLTTAQLEGRMTEILGRPMGLYDLSKKSAGVVIDALTSQPNDTKAASRF